MAISTDTYPNNPDAFSLVGREDELQLLRTFMDRCKAGQGSVTLIAGEAGIGKTSLVRATLVEARKRGFLALSGSAYDLSATPPYGLWLELISDYRPEGELPELPTFITDREAFASLSSQERLHAEVLAFFEHIAGVQPVLLALEDLHWSDQSSLELLRVLARFADRHGVMLIATYRDEQITRSSPLHLLLPALVRESSPQRIDLRPLDQSAVSTLVNQHEGLGGSHRDDVVRYLLTWGEGNPLYTVELLRTLGPGESLGDAEEGPSSKNLSRPAVPILIRQMVEQQLASMDDNSYSSLQAAAVIGQVVPLDLWERVAGSDAALSAFEKSAEHGLIAETDNGRSIAFRHALMREAVYASIPLVQRRSLHQRIADVLMGESRIDPDVVAYHLQRANDSRAAEWLILAGEQAERRFAWHEAFERHSEAAERLLNEPEQQSVRAGLLLKLGRLLRFTDPRRGVDYLEESRRVALGCGDSAVAGLALYNQGNNLCMVGEPRVGLPYMQEAINELLPLREQVRHAIRWSQTLVSGELDPLYSSFGTLTAELAYSGRYREAIATAHHYVDLNLEDADAPDRFAEIFARTASFADGYWGLAVAHTALGNLTEGRAAFNLTRRILKEFNYDAYRIFITSSYLLMHQLVFRSTALAERRELVADIENSMAISSGSAGWRNAYWGYERYLLLEGKWRELRRLIDEIDPPTLAVFRNAAFSSRAFLAWRQGRLDEAQDYLGQMRPESKDSQSDEHMDFLQREPERIAAGMAIESGAYDQARKLLTDHDRWMAQSESIIGKAEACLLWAKLALAEGDAAVAEEMAGNALNQAHNPEQPLALVDIYRFLGALSMSKRDFVAADEQLHRSLELADAAALPYERALTLLELAELRTESGDIIEPKRLLSECRRICAELDARPTLERIERLSARLGSTAHSSEFGLTARELEVLRCLARGMADKDIADELFISPHTVMRHVSSIRRKLDVNSRTAAAVVAARKELI